MFKRHLRIAAVSVGLVASAQGVASGQAGLYTPPEGCEAYLTVQQKSCRVEHHYTCAATGSDRWRIAFTEDGPVYLSRTDFEAQWLVSRFLPDGGETETRFPADDAASVTTLLETGYDDFDFLQRRPSGRVERVVGEDRITGAPVVIDGEPLLPTTFKVTYYSETGDLLGTYEGREFVSERHRRFFAGRGLSTFDGVERSFDRSPMAFDYPGDAGFLSTEPLYDCGVLMSRLEAQP